MFVGGVSIFHCTPQDHDRLRADRAALLARTVPQGEQEDGEGGVVLLRRCDDCGSTLAVRP
jgi:hypothetical protein